MRLDTLRKIVNGKTYISHLLRHAYRDNGRVRHRTIANLTGCPDDEIEAIRLALQHKGDLTQLASLKNDLSIKQGLAVGAVFALWTVAKRLGIVAALGTSQDATYVDFIRDRDEGPPDRTGDPTDLRLTEKWTSSAKSVFHFDVQGSVAKSTHAGLPWLRRIREEVGNKVHFWPFDGWDVPENKSVIAEVYPSILRKRYPRRDRTADQQDAFCVARWLTEADKRGFLAQYFQPSLTDEERETANLEGWILGIL